MTTNGFYYHKIRGEGWQCNVCGETRTSHMIMRKHAKGCKEAQDKYGKGSLKAAEK